MHKDADQLAQVPRWANQIEILILLTVGLGKEEIKPHTTRYVPLTELAFLNSW